MPRWRNIHCAALRLLGACCACAVFRLCAIDAAALPLPYPSNYPSENFVPGRVDIRNSPGIESPEQVAMREQPPSSKGIQFSKLLLRPFATTDATYSDNSVRDRLNRQEDVLLDYTTGLTSTFKPMECVSAKVNYEFGWHDYARDTARDFLSHIGYAEVKLDRVGVEGLTLLFTDSYFQSGNTNALENQIAQFARYQTNSAQFRTIYSYNRFTISGSYNHSIVDYFSRLNSGSDYMSHGGALDIAWKIPDSRIEVFQNSQYLRTLFDSAKESDYDTITLMSGLRGRYSKLIFSVGVGYTKAVPLHDEKTQSGPAFNANINYVPHRRINVEVSANRAFQAGVQTGSETVTDLRAVLNMVLTRRGKLTLSYNRNFSERRSGTELLSVAYTSRFEYKIARNITLNTGFTRIERESVPLNTDTYLINEARAGFKLDW